MPLMRGWRASRSAPDWSPTEIRYRELLEHLPVGVYRTTVEGELIECNRALAAMLGYADAAELQRVRVPELYVHPSDRALHLGGDADRPAEFELRRKDGSTLWVRDYTHAVPGSGGGVAWCDGILVDITSERQALDALRSSEADYRGLFESAHDAIVIFETDDQVILEANNRACEIYGYSRTELVGMSLWRIVKDAAGGSQRLRDLLAGKGEASFEAAHLRKDGAEMTVEVNAAVVTHQGRPAVLYISRDVTERKRMEETIRALAMHDPLTGLPNRKLLYDRLGVAIAAARRNRHMLALMYLDLDGFKGVNDRLGHAAGDELLVAISRRLAGALRDSDTVGRMGGDEFTVLISDVPSGEAAREIARKILSELRKPVSVDGEQMTVTASLGFALFPKDGGTPDELLRCADAAMYRAKGAGKDRFDQSDA
jgi:diguanylate cyclase (GGDEF)-like protein/PAS domain S-box-containing protein